ncbi:nucleotide sugar dehydrogenase [Nitrososphaera sp.]|uniref:nucleotide sugar dehydrogenase n=1 Tax=Nitrososphaera sp. TaxID=1971748 RepID=UPI0031810F9F
MALLRICVVGLGYIGLPTALMFAKSGHKVIGFDIVESKVKDLNNGICRSEEEEVRKLFDDPEVRKNFSADTMPHESDVFIIAVPTPVKHDTKEADLSHVVDSMNTVLKVLKKGNLVVIESTIPPGTCRDVVRPIIEKTGLKVSKDVFLAHCPEQILVGNSIHDLKNNAKIVGGVDQVSTQKAKVLYQSFVKGQILATDDVTAEIAKVAANAYRDVNIAFANEVAEVCERLNVLPSEAIRLANTNPRVHIHQPGIGVGGHCIAVDPYFISTVFPEQSRLIIAARSINDGKPRIVFEKIKGEMKNGRGLKLVVCGIAYKPNLRDTRESPALVIIDLLKKDGYDVTVYDPLVYPEQEGRLSEFAKNRDALVILVPHDSVVRELEYNYEEIRSLLTTHTILRF